MPASSECLATPDGDSIELWHVAPTHDGPRVLLLHGLEGGARSHYVGGLLHMARRQDWGADLLIFRGLHLVEESPIIGTGLGSFAGVIPDYLNPTQLYDYPHNVPLEIAAETGLVGFALLLVPLLVGWALLLWRGISLASPAIAAVMMLGTIFFVVANLSGDIPSERGMWIFGIVALKLALDHTPRPAPSK